MKLGCCSDRVRHLSVTAVIPRKSFDAERFPGLLIGQWFHPRAEDETFRGRIHRSTEAAKHVFF